MGYSFKTQAHFVVLSRSLNECGVAAAIWMQSPDYTNCMNSGDSSYLTMTCLQLIDYQAAKFCSAKPYLAASFLRNAIFLAFCLAVSTFNFSLSKATLCLTMV